MNLPNLGMFFFESLMQKKQKHTIRQIVDRVKLSNWRRIPERPKDYVRKKRAITTRWSITTASHVLATFDT